MVSEESHAFEVEFEFDQREMKIYMEAKGGCSPIQRMQRVGFCAFSPGVMDAMETVLNHVWCVPDNIFAAAVEAMHEIVAPIRDWLSVKRDARKHPNMPWAHKRLRLHVTRKQGEAFFYERPMCDRGMTRTAPKVAPSKTHRDSPFKFKSTPRDRSVSKLTTAFSKGLVLAPFPCSSPSPLPLPLALPPPPPPAKPTVVDRMADQFATTLTLSGAAEAAPEPPQDVVLRGATTLSFGGFRCAFARAADADWAIAQYDVLILATQEVGDVTVPRSRAYFDERDGAVVDELVRVGCKFVNDGID